MIHKRICIVMVVDDLGYGGAERQVIELANRLDRNRFDSHVCALSNHAPLREGLLDAENRFHVVSGSHRYDLTIVSRLSQLLRRLNADIVHGYLFKAEIVSRLAGRLAGVKVIIGSERNANHSVKTVHKWAYKVTQRCVDAVVANSSAGAEWNRKVFGLPLSHYRVVHNGVDTDRFRPITDTGKMREELKLSAESPIVGVFANFKKQKNHAMLYRAFKLVLRTLPEAHLVLVGHIPTDSRGKLDSYRSYLDRLADDMGIRHQCTFLGHRSDTESLYPMCDVTVLSSLHEGTPNVLLESMACGVPVIATRVCDNPLIVKEGSTGYLVRVDDDATLADRIVKLLSNKTGRDVMGRNARAWVMREFSGERLAAKVEELYTELLSAKNGHSPVD